jgi:hypothetical protein
MLALLQRIYFLNLQKSKNLCIFLDDMTPKVKITGFTGHVVLNQIKGFILVTFKDYKIGVHKLGYSRNNLLMSCERCISIKCEDAQVILKKSEWACIMTGEFVCTGKYSNSSDRKNC